ncbi:hypothetical protein HD806DRAFT_523761 [Xylariaceae sp. AK1471]|nr:hypothetical protein HD806DRAFT_523761 [Xylariaceae sp. AK1471]
MPVQLKTFRSIMPKAGMKYKSLCRVMHSTRRDQRVASSIAAARYELTPTSVSLLLARMFEIAAPIVVESHAKGEDLWDALPWVQHKIDWAERVPQAVFFEFFCCLVEARHEWEKEPTYPFFRYDQYDPAVRALVEFRRAVGDGSREDKEEGSNDVSWVLIDAVFFNDLARGYAIDEDEDEDVEMPDRDEVERVERMVQQLKIEQGQEEKQ